jgi:hypothetical protein
MCQFSINFMSFIQIFGECGKIVIKLMFDQATMLIRGRARTPGSPLSFFFFQTDCSNPQCQKVIFNTFQSFAWPSYHATHVCGMLCGASPQSPYNGVAPGAQLVLFHLDEVSYLIQHVSVDFRSRIASFSWGDEFYSPGNTHFFDALIADHPEVAVVFASGEMSVLTTTPDLLGSPPSRATRRARTCCP